METPCFNYDNKLPYYRLVQYGGIVWNTLKDRSSSQYDRQFPTKQSPPNTNDGNSTRFVEVIP